MRRFVVFLIGAVLFALVYLFRDPIGMEHARASE